MPTYTVVLHDCHNDYPVLYVEARNAAEAIRKAASENFKIGDDAEDRTNPVAEKDYTVCAVFRGHAPIAEDWV